MPNKRKKIKGEAARYGEVFYPNWALAPMGMELEPGALKASIERGPRVTLHVEHEGWPLAATFGNESSLLSVEATETGVDYSANVDENQADVLLAWQKVDAGLFPQASVGLYIVDADWAMRGSKEILLVSEAELDMGDISVVRYGANDKTSSEAESQRSNLRTRYADEVAI